MYGGGLVRGLRLLGAAIVCGALVLVLCDGAQAAANHDFLAGVTAKINETSLGPGSRSMTVDSGSLYVAGGQSESTVARFDASSGALQAELPPVPPPIYYLHQGITVGHATGEAQIYVGGDEYPEGRAEGIVTVLSSSGAVLGVWRGTDTPQSHFACFECYGPGSIAADESSNVNDWAKGDVYVADWENGVVDVFHPEAGGGEKYVTQLTGPEPPGKLFSGPKYIAVDQATGRVLVADGDQIDVFAPSALPEQYEFSGVLAGPPPSGTFERISGLAVDGGNGDIYVAAGYKPAVVDEFNSAGLYIGHLTGTGEEAFHTIESVTVDRVSHDVYVSDFSEKTQNSTVYAFGPNIVTPDLTTGAPTGVKTVGSEGLIEATLNGTVNPDGEGEAACWFEWGTTPSLGQESKCEPEKVADGTSPVPVHSTLSGVLLPDTTYYFRLEASNKNGTNPGEGWQDVQFTTPGPGLRDESASNVASTTATLDATVNPHGAPTSYYFQYGTGTSYEAEIPLAPGEALGSGEADAEVSRHVQGLTPATIYHYRVVAVSELAPGQYDTFAGADQTFTTQAAGVEFALLDGRQWEQVTPADKHGSALIPITEGAMIKASASGQAFTGVGSSPTEANPSGYSNGEQYISIRGQEGWSTQDISLQYALPPGPTLARGQDYRFFSEDLSLGLVEPFGGGGFTSLAPEASPADTELTPYLRHDFTCAATPTTCYEPLLTSASGFEDVPAGTKFGDQAQFTGGTPDLSHVILTSGVQLTPTATSQPELYEWTYGKPPAEELQLVSIMPKGDEPATGFVDLGFANDITQHAISDDGARAVFSVDAGYGRNLFLRDMRAKQTVQVDAVQPGASGKNEPASNFQAASADDSRIFFVDSQRLTSNAGSYPGESDLYECEIVNVGEELQCKLTDLTPPVAGESADVGGGYGGGVVGVSEDGSYVYFTAKGRLTSEENEHHEKAIAGASNLYLLHRSSTGAGWDPPRFIATLSEEDANHDATAYRKGHTARVSPSGRYLSFMSNHPLTGYNNRDVNSGQADEEVFLFDAQTGELVCASCNPSGARPAGREYKTLNDKLVGGDRIWDDEVWIAANIPGWTPAGDKGFYQSRYLSDEGRLFFNSSDALVAHDINGTEDVYEYEPPGVGSCTESAPTFSERSGGCINLISSGASTEESAFLDASSGGNDVFFLTAEKLAPGDIDTAVDVYDAHACTSSAPCFSYSATSPPCTTADACRTAPGPQPSLFGAPSSATFAGNGNVSRPAVKPPPPSSGRAQRLAKALKACRKKKSRRKRAACERQARRRYGAQRSGKANANKRSRG